MDNSLKNYTLNIFLKQSQSQIEDTMTMLRYMRPRDTGRQAFDLSLREVQSLKDNLLQGDFNSLIECVRVLEDIEVDEIMRMNIVSFWGKVLSIKKQIEDININETKTLSSDHANFKWEAVNGSDKMSKFGIYNTLDTLSGGNILLYEQILDLPYADIFIKMYMNRVKSDLDTEMSQLKTNR